MEFHTVDAGIELDKRFYLNGVVLKSDCSTCGQPISTDLGDDYVSCPSTGETIEKQIWCMACHESGVDSFLTKKMTIQILVIVE